MTAATALQPAAASAQERVRLGTAMLRAGFTSQAERELRNALELDPGCAGAWVNLGGILFSRWEYGAAVEANRRAAQADPTLAIAHFNQGLGHLQLGEAARAAECLEKAVGLEPGNGAAYHHLAIALYALGRPLEARLCAEYAKELGYQPNRVSQEALERAAAAAEGG
ncbi:MAG TPA: tetratricopeptide repeat protein [Anaeromyxobacter sp.]